MLMVICEKNNWMEVPQQLQLRIVGDGLPKFSIKDLNDQHEKSRDHDGNKAQKEMKRPNLDESGTCFSRKLDLICLF